MSPVTPSSTGSSAVATVGNRDIATSGESSVQDLERVLTVQKKAFLEEGLPTSRSGSIG